MDKDEWGTPQDFFQSLDDMLDFTLDPCANLSRKLKPDNKMIHLPKSIDGLQADWAGQSVFVNPPFSGKQVELWVRKCYEERHNAHDILLLIPANRVSASYFHSCVLGSAEVAFIPGRINFVPLANQKVSSNPMPIVMALWQSSTEKDVDLPGRIDDFENRW